MNLGNQMPYPKKFTGSLSEQPDFQQVMGVDTTAIGFNHNPYVKLFDMNMIPHSAVSLTVTEAFEGGTIFNKMSLFKNKKVKNSVQTFLTRLGKTPYDRSRNYNKDRSGWVSPNFLDALHQCMSEYFGPAALAFLEAETPAKPPARPVQPQAANRNPYRMKQPLEPVTDPSVEVVELTPALCALTLDTVPAPHGVMKQTYFNVLTPPHRRILQECRKESFL